MNSSKDSYLRQALFECYREAGADTDGDETPDARGDDQEVGRRAIQAVKTLRRDYEAALDEIPNRG